MTELKSLGTDARAPMSRATRGIIFAVAAALVAALFTTVAAVQPPASAASFEAPSVTWKQVEGPASLGTDRCRFTATTELRDNSSMTAALETLATYPILYDSVSDGSNAPTLTLKSDLFNCADGVANLPTTGNASPLRLGKNNVAIWILGGAVGAAIAVAAALFGGPIVAAAAAAAGVTLSAETAAIIAGCLGGAVGGAVGEYIKGNDAPRMATSAILNCAGGTIIGLFKSKMEAAETVAEAAMELSRATSAQISQAVTRATSAFSSQISGVAAEAATVADRANPLESAVLQALRELRTS